jgi:hypothetical protein
MPGVRDAKNVCVTERLIQDYNMVEYKGTTRHLGFHLDILGSAERTQLFNAPRFAQPELYRRTVNTVLGGFHRIPLTSSLALQESFAKR